MSEREATIRTSLITYFPMFIATLSLVTSIYNGYLNNRFVDIIQRNIARGEAMKSCKEIIDAYFQVKFRAGIVSENGARERASGAPDPAAAAAQIEAANAVNKVGALGTYLANMQDDATRERYTHLTWELEKVVREASRIPPAELGNRFDQADRMFDGMNGDCVRTAKQ